MEFLDKDTELLLKACVDNESTYPAVLRDMFSKISHVEDSVLRSQIKLLKDEGYISPLQWGDNVPFYGRIEQKGRTYFKNKEIYVRSMLRNNPCFPLDDESEQCLSKLLSQRIVGTYFTVTDSDIPAVVLTNLIDTGIVKVGKQGIGFDMSGGFACVIMITQYGRTYFSEKEKYIEEILTFPTTSSRTSIQNQYNVNAGDYSPIQVGNISCEQNVEYDFDQAQEAINEVRERLNELSLSSAQQLEVIENLNAAQDLITAKKRGPLKAILKATYEIIKDVGCAIVSGLLLAKMQGL